MIINNDEFRFKQYTVLTVLKFSFNVSELLPALLLMLPHRSRY